MIGRCCLFFICQLLLSVYETYDAAKFLKKSLNGKKRNANGGIQLPRRKGHFRGICESQKMRVLIDSSHDCTTKSIESDSIIKYVSESGHLSKFLSRSGWSPDFSFYQKLPLKHILYLDIYYVLSQRKRLKRKPLQVDSRNIKMLQLV